MRQEDICTHLGDLSERYLGAVTPPIFQSSIFVDCPNNENGKEGRYAYTRVSNPTTEIAEEKIAALEKGEKAKCFSSGMGAISAAIMHYIKGGCHVVGVASCYGPARRFLEDYLKKFNVSVTFVSGIDTDEIEAAITANTSLIYLESPSTYLFHLQNLKEVVEVAKRHGAATVMDNTYATPIYQQPLEYGIDMVVHSASKYMGGHSDIIGGIVVGKEEDINQISLNERELFGAVMSPFDSWLLLRGIRTLSVRMPQHQKNALEFVNHFVGHPFIKEIIYPWHESHPQYLLAKKQMSGCSGLMSLVFDLPPDTIEDISRELRMFYEGPSWGGYESMFLPVGTKTDRDTDTVKKGMVRVHIGLENTETLIEDLELAMAKCI